MSSPIEGILAVIRTIPLPPPKESLGTLATPQPGINQGFANDGSLVYLDENIPVDSKSDALWWTLFASLAATAAVKEQGKTRTSDPELWYKKYIETFKRIGMSASGFQRDSVPQHSIQVTVDKTVLQLAAASFTPNQLANVTSLLSALYESKDEKALFCFDRDASDNGDANFQVLHGEVDEYLNLTLSAVFLDFKTSQNIDRMPFWRWTNRDISLFQAHGTLTLTKKVADSVRDVLFERIKDYLSDKTKEILLE